MRGDSRPGSSLRAVSLVALGVLLAPVAASGQDLSSDLLQQGRWDEASRQSLERDDVDSLLVRSRFSFWAGDDEEAGRFIEAAVAVGGREGERRRARREQARMQWFLGKRDEAIQGLRDLLQEAPQEVETRFWLGSFLIDDGAVEEGRAILEAPAQRFNDGLISDHDELVWLGRSMAEARRPRDANRAFSRVLRENVDHLEANLRLGQLMWSHYNAAEAEEAFERVLALQEDNPEALVGMARIEFFRSGRFVLSMERVEEALARAPGHPDVLAAQAELLLAQGRWEDGLAVAEGLLERGPAESEPLSLLAAAQYLLGRDEASYATRQRFDARRANRAELLRRLGEVAAFNRRNHEAIEFFRKAIDRDAEDAGALTGIGLALTRIGEESEGLDFLERASRADPYHVRVYNTLEFYGRGLRSYITEDVDGFRLRAHQEHFSLLRELSEPLVNEALADMSARYGRELPSLTLEVYVERENFAVRSVGLPNIDPHGICFGPVILTRNPAEGDFNWPLVVWHEIAHSFHLELSNYRVPAWFTEGLAEYETYRRNPSWTRFYDVEIVRLLAHDRLWDLGELDQVFMTGRGMDVVLAYQTALLVMLFLEETRGFEAIVAVLQGYGEEADTGAVLEKALGMDIGVLNQEFRDFLHDRYAGLMAQPWVDGPRVRAMLEGEEVEHRTRGQAAAYRALVAALRGEREQMELQIEHALNRGGDEAEVYLVLVMLHHQRGAVEEGLRLGREALEKGFDGLDLRMHMALLARSAEERVEGLVHAIAATTLAPEDAEAWRTLMSFADELQGEGRLVAQGRREFFRRSPHQRLLARQIALSAQEAGDLALALEAGQRWSEVAAMDAEAHLFLGRVHVGGGDLDRAAAAFRRAALASPPRKGEIFEEAAGLLRDAGGVEQAHEFDVRN